MANVFDNARAYIAAKDSGLVPVRVLTAYLEKIRGQGMKIRQRMDGTWILIDSFDNRKQWVIPGIRAKKPPE